ncbi:MAG: SMC-Scp complex subunit ScpB [Oscillospiraceae bacterium]|jgi:segregation and condensation protein B|nr:SMC-Scp complex subunit ScpB [Oscillospiraceae bacterium]
MNELEAAAEAILFASGEPLELTRLAEALGVDETQANALADALATGLEERGSGLSLVRMADMLQLCTRPQFSDCIRAALTLKSNTPLSPAAFEVLAVVAYHQPVTKAYIEQVRGVDCHHMVSSLCQKGLMEERGRLDLPGRPLIYGTTEEFLKCFCLESLDDLPPLPPEEPAAEALPAEITEN